MHRPAEREQCFAMRQRPELFFFSFSLACSVCTVGSGAVHSERKRKATSAAAVVCPGAGAVHCTLTYPRSLFFSLVHSFRHSVVLRLLLRPALHFRVPTTSSSSIQPLSDGSTIHNSSFFNCQQCSFSVRVLSLLLLPLPPSNEECLVSNANVRRSERKKESIESDGQWKCSQIDRKVLDGHRLG